MKKQIVIISLFFVSLNVSGEWKEIALQPGESVWASSSLTETLQGVDVTYGPEALFDMDIESPWVEGVSGSGTGETITILTQRAVTGFRIINGFAASDRFYSLNNRVKKISLSLLAGLTAPGMVSELDFYQYLIRELPVYEEIELEDSPAEQFFQFPLTTEKQYAFFSDTVLQFRDDNPFLFRMIVEDLGISETEAENEPALMQIMEIYGFFSLKITIEDVYKGSRYDDTCISEISITTEPF